MSLFTRLRTAWQFVKPQPTQTYEQGYRDGYDLGYAQGVAAGAHAAITKLHAQLKAGLAPSGDPRHTLH